MIVRGSIVPTLCIHEGHIVTKESGFRVRVNEGLRQDFLAACRANDLTASQVIRRFMKDYVQRELPSSDRQQDLFINGRAKPFEIAATDGNGE